MAAGPYVPITSGGDASLICLPWAAAGARPFRSWRPGLPRRLAVSVARLGGREDRFAEPPPADWAALVTELTDALPVIGPYVLFGHCLGALTAYEVALERRRRGQELPAALLVVGDPPASAGGPRVVDAVAAMRETGAMDDRILDNPDVYALFERVVRADLDLAADYRFRAEPRLPVPIAVFLPSAHLPGERTTAEGWAAATSERLRVVTIEGGSLYPHGAWAALGAAVADAASAALALRAQAET